MKGLCEEKAGWGSASVISQEGKVDRCTHTSSTSMVIELDLGRIVTDQWASRFLLEGQLHASTNAGEHVPLPDDGVNEPHDER